MKISIQAKSSSSDPYTVDFLIEEGELSVHCNCQAGIFEKLCKHKAELIAGDQLRLFDESEIPKLKELESIVSKAQELGAIAREIAESEKIIRQEQTKLKESKKSFGEKLKDGTPITEL